MNGTTVKRYIAPLTAGVEAIYTSASPAPPAYYRHADWLGSSRLATTSSRTVYYDGAYAPFGENYAEMGTTDRSFTGDTQDIESGLYDFTFRQQSSAQGRWLVPDPAGLAAVDITNPQTWNRYAYVGNNPLNATDPLGLYCAVGVDGGTLNGCNQGAAGYNWGPGEFAQGYEWPSQGSTTIVGADDGRLSRLRQSPRGSADGASIFAETGTNGLPGIPERNSRWAIPGADNTSRQRATWRPTVATEYGTVLSPWHSNPRALSRMTIACAVRRGQLRSSSRT